jgi:LCP family protein required for cell wall assembly
MSDQLPVSLDPRGRRASRNHGTSRPRRHSRGRDVLRGVNIGTQVIAAVLSLVIVLGSGLAWSTYRSALGNVRRVDAIPATPPTGADGNAVPDVDGKDQNILIVGNDDRDSATDAELNILGIGRDGGSLNTDTMMLMHVPADGSRATAISFPRDSYVSIPGYGKNKLNSAYFFGSNYGKDKDAGARLLVQTIQNLTGLTIDHFVQVDLIGFYRISEAIGGVEICLNNAVQEGYSGVNLPAGVQTISGVQALAFVRQRYNFPDGNGDLDRIKRQQVFLGSAFRKIESAGTLLNYGKLKALITAVTSSLTMDSGLDPLKLAQQMRKLSSGNVTFVTIPTLGFATEDVGSVVVVDTAGLPDFVNGVIGTGTPDGTYTKAVAAAPSSVTVDVYNAANVQGIASSNAAALKAQGFLTATVDSTTPTSSTTIKYPAGMEAQAKALAAAVPAAKVIKSTTVTRVTLTLGTDGVQVASLTPTPTPGTAASTPTTTTSAPANSRTAADTSCID